MSSIITVENATKTYGQHQVHALNGVSLSVGKGEFIALMGPSGCGKSTLLNLIGAIDTPTEGSVRLDGTRLEALSEAERTELRKTRLGFIFQFFNLLSTLTVRENVALPLELGGAADRKVITGRVDAIMAEVGLTHRADFYPALLSGGEMQRVAIARALIHQPDVIIADEPTGNLDTETGERVLALIRGLAKDQGRTVIMATHSAEAAAVADRILRMRDGKLIE